MYYFCKKTRLLSLGVIIILLSLLVVNKDLLNQMWNEKLDNIKAIIYKVNLVVN